MTDDGRQMTDDGRQMTDDGRQMTDDGRQMTDDGRRMTRLRLTASPRQADDGRQRAEAIDFGFKASQTLRALCRAS